MIFRVSLLNIVFEQKKNEAKSHQSGSWLNYVGTKCVYTVYSYLEKLIVHSGRHMQHYTHANSAPDVSKMYS